MNYFSHFHPAVIFLYFIVVMAINIVIFDPVLIGIFFVSQALLYLYLKGAAGAKFVGKCLLLVLVCGGFNGLVNHRGIHVIFYLGGLPVTGECIFYGCMTGGLLAASICLFGCYNDIMTSEKIMSLFGNVFPHFSLVFSMALRLIPKVQMDYKKIRENHKKQKGVLTALVGMALEDSLETGIVMGYRGYGKNRDVRRTSIYHKQMRNTDWVLAGGMGVLALGGVFLYLFSQTEILVFPYIDYHIDRLGAGAYFVFWVLFFLPVFINMREELKWKHIISNI